MLQLANNAKTTLSFGIGTTDTTLQIPSVDVALFPALVMPGDFFMAALANNPTGGATLKTEYVKVTAVTGTTLTVERAQEGTTAQAFDAGDRFELRLTAGAVADLRGDVWGRPVSGGDVQTPTRVDDTSFTLPGDFTAEFETFRAVRAYQTADAQGHVVSSIYSGGVTTVVVEGMTLDTGLALVEYGMDVASAPKYTHAATADSASDADMLGGQLPAYYVNRAVATQAEAEAGALDTVVMTPLKTTEHFQDRLGGFNANGFHGGFSGDLDTQLGNGTWVINIAACPNGPSDFTVGWALLIVDLTTSTNLYARQEIKTLTVNSGYSWTRQRLNGVWQAWRANGINGDADTLDGYHAAAFAPVDTANNGMLEYVNSFPFSAVANIDITSLTPGRYRVLFEDVYGSNGTPLRLQAIDSTVISATNYMYTLNHGTQVTGATFIQLVSSKATSVSYGMDGAVDVTLGALSGKRFQAAWQLNLAAEYMVGAGTYTLSTIEADGIRIMPESGTITGTIHLYKFKDV